MPHGLTVESVTSRMELKRSIWVRPLNDRNKSKKPLRLIDVAGTYARLEIIDGDRARQIRVPLEKLEYTDPPPPPKGEKPVPPPPPAKPVVRESVLEMFPVLREEILGPPPVAEPKPVEPPKIVEPTVSQPAPAPKTYPKTSDYVVYETGSKKYYTEAHTWTWDLNAARKYDGQGSANRAAGRLVGKSGKSQGKEVVVLRAHVAHEMFDAQKTDGEVKASPDAPAVEKSEVVLIPPAPLFPTAEPLPPRTFYAAAKPTGTAPAKAPEPAKPTTMSDEMVPLQARLEDAMRNELFAYEVLNTRKIELARIKHEIDVFIARKRNAYR